VHNPNAFSQLRSLARHSQPITQKLWLPSQDAIFLIRTCACALKDHLATTRNIITEDRWIRKTVSVCTYLGMGSKNRCMRFVVNQTTHLKRLR